MGDDDLREILERLETLERLARSRSGGRGGGDDHRRNGRDRHDHDHGRHDHDRHDHDRGHHGRDDRFRGRADGEFQEKRIIDTVVRLVGERIERGLQDQQAKMHRRDDGDREKRVVDLVVRLVGEHVRAIVQEVLSDELDRRHLGRPPGDPPPQHGESSEPDDR